MRGEPLQFGWALLLSTKLGVTLFGIAVLRSSYPVARSAIRRWIPRMKHLHHPLWRPSLLPFVLGGFWLNITALSLPLLALNLAHGAESPGPSLAGILFTAAFAREYTTYAVLAMLRAREAGLGS